MGFTAKCKGTGTIPLSVHQIEGLTAPAGRCRECGYLDAPVRRDGTIGAHNDVRVMDRLLADD